MDFVSLILAERAKKYASFIVQVFTFSLKTSCREAFFLSAMSIRHLMQQNSNLSSFDIHIRMALDLTDAQCGMFEARRNKIIPI